MKVKEFICPNCLKDGLDEEESGKIDNIKIFRITPGILETTYSLKKNGKISNDCGGGESESYFDYENKNEWYAYCECCEYTLTEQEALSIINVKDSKFIKDYGNFGTYIEGGND